MAPSIVYGDAERLVAAILRDAITDDAVGISSDLVGYDRDQSWLVITRIGGEPTPYIYLDHPQIAIDAYAPDKGAAFDLAQSARAAVFAARGYVGDDCTLYDVGDAQGFTWEADADEVARYTFTLSLVTRPTT